MGLISAAFHSVGSVMADQWKEFFYCEALKPDVLVVKGQKVIGNKSSNKKGSDNIITQGSGIVVADGQCMIIVDNGQVVDICSVPGEYTYDMSSEPSVFTQGLKEGLKDSWKKIKERFANGGSTGHDQRIYYFNTKELIDNKFGTQNPVPFRTTYTDIGRSFTAGVRCNGVYSYKIEDPVLFYTNVCGNVSSAYTRSDIDQQLKSEFLNALQPAFAKISETGIRYDQLPGQTESITEAMNAALTKKWKELRGLEVISVAINSVTISKEDEDRIKKFEDMAWNRDASNAAAMMVGAQADAMGKAASNSAGAMNGFFGMNMAQQAGGLNANALFQMGANNAASVSAAGSWKCSCGASNTGKFCAECGKPKPADASGWTCSCGTVNKGKFCAECGKPKPDGAPKYRCDKCGWEPSDPFNPPKFCAECGDPFTDADIVK